uniref:Uncharacterized protein n=1 Tax=Tetranychus urticae TaxID=32264 RepID=T1JQZ2_TETUR
MNGNPDKNSPYPMLIIISISLLIIITNSISHL